MRCAKFFILSLLVLAVSFGNLAASAEHHSKRSFAVIPGGTLRVDGGFQDIKLQLAPGNSVDIAVDMKVSSWPKDPEEVIKAHAPVYSMEGSTMVVRCRPKSGFGWGITNSSGTIAIKMPPGMAILLDTGSGDIEVKGDAGPVKVSCDTGSGDIKVEGSCKEFGADTGSGSVIATLSGQVSTAKVDTGSGDVTFRGTVGEIAVDTGSGNITVEGLTGGASLNTGSGDIRARWAGFRDGSRVAVDTGSGEVSIAMPAGTALSGELASSSGGIRSDFPGTSSERGRHFKLNGGTWSSKINVHTGSGDIQLANK